MSRYLLALAVTCASVLHFASAALADYSGFVGDFVGSAVLERADGTTSPRDMSVSIRETKEGFSVAWSSTSYRDDGRAKAKSYEIEFIPSGRGEVFAAAMRRNVFGHTVQLDPMKGEPYVWARIEGATLTVYSLYVGEDGRYELQQFDRTIVDGGLELHFTRFSNGEKSREIRTLLERQ